MSGVNKVILVGRLGQDPEVKRTASGDAVVNFGLATSEVWKDKIGEKQERTEWHRCVAWRQLAEIIERYVRKGSQLYVEGKLQTRKWQASDGSDRYSTEIVISQMQMLDAKPSGSAPRAETDRNRASQNMQAPSGKDYDDDIPF